MIKKLLFIIAISLFALSAYLVYDYCHFIKQRNQLIQQKGEETTAALRNQVNDLLLKIVAEGNRLAELFGSNEYNKAEIEAIIKESSLQISEIQGVTACFEPYGFSAKERLYCPYYNKGAQDYVFVEESYDYTDDSDPATTWYTGVRDNGAKWVEPYFAKAAQDWYIDYGIPFYYQQGENKGKVRGTITMSFVASGFKNLIHSLALGKTGYGVITSSQGTVLAHPVNEYVGTTNLKEIKENVTPELAEAFDQLLAREQGNIQFFDAIQESETLFYFDKIPVADWGIGLLFYKEDLLKDSKELRQRYIKISLAISLFFVCLLAIYFNKDHLDEQEIWILSLVSSLLLLANILFIGYLQHTDKHVHEDTKSPPITDIAALNRFVHLQHQRADELKTHKATPVPTGIYVERMEFEDSYNLNIGGKIWQKYPLDKVDEVSIGFQLPQLSPFAESAYVEEAYRRQIEPKEDEAGYLLVGWEVRVTLRLNLRYADYPLDKRHINIEIAPLNIDDHLIFTPDLASYNYTNPFRKSGLNPAVKIAGSEVVESYFNFSLESYDSDFGFGDKSMFEEVPILHYNIHTRRLLLNAFVTYLIPIFVTLIMVFILIYACHKTQERQGIIESMAAFFFVLIFSHIDMRREIVTADLIYLEYFYFIAYFLLVSATANLITYTKDKSRIFDFNDNQVFKAIYFPTFFFLVLVVTLVKFY